MRARAISLREAGATVRAIAAELGVPRATVGDWTKGIDPLPAIEDAPPVDLRVHRLRKWCAGCEQDKPWADYWTAAKWPDGSMRRPQAKCKECVKAARRQRRREDPERARETDRRDRERIQADPERLVRRRELTRENGVAHRRRKGALPWAEYVEQRRAA